MRLMMPTETGATKPNRLRVILLFSTGLDFNGPEDFAYGFFVNEEYESTSSLVRAGFKDFLTVWKCLLHTTLAEMSSLRATIPASLHRPSSSAPVKSSVFSAIFLDQHHHPLSCSEYVHGVSHNELLNLEVAHTAPTI